MPRDGSDPRWREMKVRVPDELRRWIGLRARQNRRSLSNQVVVSLEAAREAEKAGAAR